MKILDKTNTPKTEIMALLHYFGRLPGQSIAEFNEECKRLTPEGKTELAIGAARELGWTVEV